MQRYIAKSSAMRVKAKELFFRYYPLSEIARLLEVKESRVYTWSHKGEWLKERSAKNEDIIAQYVAGKGEKMVQISNLSLSLIARSLNELAKRTNPPSLNEAKAIADIFCGLDKIIKLDAGQATERIEYSAVTIDDIRAALNEDKFIDILPVAK